MTRIVIKCKITICQADFTNDNKWNKPQLYMRLGSRGIKIRFTPDRQPLYESLIHYVELLRVYRKNRGHYQHDDISVDMYAETDHPFVGVAVLEDSNMTLRGFKKL